MTTDDSRFLVMGITGPILCDLIGAINEEFPAMAPTAVKNVVEAVEIAKLSDGWKFAFLNIGPDAFAASDLAALFVALRTKVVLLGNAAEDAAGESPFPVLMRPFSGTDILQILGYKT